MDKIINNKYIFIPTGLEAGTIKGFPIIIYTDAYTTSEGKCIELRGNKDLEELNNGRYGFYPFRRCYPYSDELWSLCQQHVQKRTELENEWDEIVKGARKKNKKFPAIK